MASLQFEKFKKTLSEVFMLDQVDLDFGIYRIMNQKRKDIDNYLNTDLVKQVKQVILDNTSDKAAHLREELVKTEETVRTLGYNPEENPKVQELREQIAAYGSNEDLENEVYSHLATFFSRYYDGGDFISQRRYKKDVYAIPYEGEEVKLYWANADQYYIKTSEYFRTYSFKTSGGKLIEFTLKDASVEQNNNKVQGNQERRFAIFEENPLEVIDNVLHINFTYELRPKTDKQSELLAAAFAVVKPLIPEEFSTILTTLSPTEKNKNRTLLEKHLNDYVARNTFDYFIHKDLKGFLSRELDFYIKNEILFIDDINAKKDSEFLQYLTVIKAVKAIGTKIIEFLSSLENFQKKLWLKKKFVVESNYCITLDRVPEELYAEVCANDAQREEWVKLFSINELMGGGAGIFSSDKAPYSEPLTEDFLKQNQFLVLDTAFFSESFKQRLVSSIDNLDQQCDGLMINSENFQALNLLQEKYKQQVKCIYIDPPYNTSEGSFIYKNLYKDSCWMTMMEDRITIARDFMNNDSVIDTAIDDFELANLQKLYDTVFGSDKRLGNLVIEIKPSGRTNDNYLATSHDYVVMYATEPYNAEISFFELSEEQKGQYKYQESGVAHKWRDFMRTGGFSTPEERPNSFYPIYYEPSTNDISLEKIDGYVEILPIDSEGKYRVWRKTKPSFLKHLDNKEIKIELAKRNSITKYKVRIIDIIKEGVRPKSVWTGSKYDASSHGTKLLKKMFGDSSPFSFPKALCATQDTIFLSVANDDSAIILDFFAGSGTTGHSVININRNDTEKGEYACRKYILVEMGEYFNSVTKPRIQKVVYSKDWSDGKPVDREGISHCFKYMRLEQYEDTLNNLIVKENEGLFGESDEYRDSYMLGYMLDTETRDSLFNLKWFENPFDVTLNVTRKNEIVSQKIDLVETFNYLIGLNVDFISYPKDGICTVEGTTRKGEKSLIIWRDCEKISNDTLENFFSKSAYSTRDSEFDRIYINGDCKIENFRSEDQSWKVILTEEEFSKRMFEE